MRSNVALVLLAQFLTAFALVCVTTLYGVSAFATKWIGSQPTVAKNDAALLPLFVQLTQRLLATRARAFCNTGCQFVLSSIHNTVTIYQQLKPTTPRLVINFHEKQLRL